MLAYQLTELLFDEVVTSQYEHNARRPWIKTEDTLNTCFTNCTVKSSLLQRLCKKQPTCISSSRVRLSLKIIIRPPLEVLFQVASSSVLSFYRDQFALLYLLKYVVYLFPKSLNFIHVLCCYKQKRKAVLFHSAHPVLMINFSNAKAH